MLHAEQIRQGRRLLELMDSRATAMADGIYRNPVSDYASPEQATLERTLLFRRYPLNLGLSCRLPDPGDWLAEEIDGMPILLARDGEGRLHAMQNICRHRGARAFKCPYHAWAYGLDGRLLARPHEAAFAELDKATHGLLPLPVEERDGLIWLLPADEARRDVKAHLGGLDEEFAAFGLDGWHHYETRTLTRRMNWKLVVDTFLETYHLSTLHRNTVHPILHTDLATFDAYGRNLRMIAARRTIDELRGQPEDAWDLVRHTAIIYVLFPNTVVVGQGDHIETWQVFPTENAPNEARMVVSFYIPEPATTEKARRHWDRNFDLLWATVLDEDFPLGEGVQRGFVHGGQQEITFGRNEPALQHFHRSVRAALDEAS